MSKKRGQVDHGEWQRKYPTGGKGGPLDYTGSAQEERDMLAGRDEESPLPSFDHVRASYGNGRTTRRSKLTEQNVETMKLLVAGGVPIPTACTAIGAGRAWSRWGVVARKDEAAGIPPGWDEGESAELYWLLQMETAKAAFETSMVARIGAAAISDWKAAAWLLERRAPARWWPKHKLDMHVNGQKALTIETMSMDKVISIARGVVPEGADFKILQADLGADKTAREVVEAEIVVDDD